MVFCGKASLSCENCRIRRIKCNKFEPECSQCVRAKKKCPGYRDQLSLMFRDETVKVRKKFEDGSGDASVDATESPPDDTTERILSSPSDSPTEPAAPEPSPAILEIPSRNRAGGQGRQDEPGMSDLTPELSRKLGKALEAYYADNLAAGGDGANANSASSSRKDTRPRKQPRRRAKAALGLAHPGIGGGTSAYENIIAAAQKATVQAMLRGPGQTPVEQGLHFYLENYLYGHPESPEKGGDVSVHIPWVLDPSARLIASAIGLAGLGNLDGNDQRRITAWQNYLTGLQMTAQTLKTPGLETLNNAMRCVVLMAMFEIVRGANKSPGHANVHVMGAAALLRHFLPILPTKLHPFRGLLQICCSLLISCIASKSYVPPVMVEYVTSTYREKPKDDQLMAELLLLLYELTNLLAYVESQALIDKRSDIAGIVVQALQLESRLLAWKLEVFGKSIWLYEEHEVAFLPPQACYKGRFHRYSDISTARIWSYYRWARILVNQLLLDFIEKCPRSVSVALVQLGSNPSSLDSSVTASTSGSPVIVASLVTAAEVNPIILKSLRDKALRIIRDCAEDIFASTPTNWRHPSIPLSDYAKIATKAPVYGANGGTGVITLMPTLFHLQTAACAPGVPYEDWKWALDVIDTVWAYLGLQQARTLGDMMRAHQEAQSKRASKSAPGGVLLITGAATG